MMPSVYVKRIVSNVMNPTVQLTDRLDRQKNLIDRRYIIYEYHHLTCLKKLPP